MSEKRLFQKETQNPFFIMAKRKQISNLTISLVSFSKYLVEEVGLNQRKTLNLYPVVVIDSFFFFSLFPRCVRILTSLLGIGAISDKKLKR